MELGLTEIKLQGGNNIAIPRIVTPAEVMVLRLAHGDLAVERVNLNGKLSDLDTKAERARLISQYPKYEEGIQKLFPGFEPNMPMTFAEIKVAEIFGDSGYTKKEKAKALAPVVEEVEDEKDDDSDEDTTASEPQKRRTKASKKSALELPAIIDEAV